jgi:hypothetical protein
MGELFALAGHRNALPGIIIMLAPAARNMVILLTQHKRGAEVVELTKQYMAVFVRYPKPDVAAEISSDFFAGAAAQLARSGDIASLRAHIAAIDDVAIKLPAATKVTFAVANAWLNAANSAANEEIFIEARNHVSRLASRSRDPRIMAGLMMIDQTLMRICVQSEDEDSVAKVAFGLIGAWQDGVRTLGSETLAWQLLVDGLSAALPLLRRKQLKGLAQAIVAALKRVDIPQPGFLRLKRELEAVG